MRARIAGREVLLLLDTGSGSFWLDKSFTDALGWAGKPGKPERIDGQEVATESLPSVELGLGKWTGKVSGVRAFPFPASLRASGIAGLLCPQRLPRSGAVVLDLASPRLWIAEGSQSRLREWLASRFPGRDFETLPRLTGRLEPAERGKDDFYAVVGGALTGLPERPLLLDSGREGASFAPAYLGKKAGAPGILRLGSHEIPLEKTTTSPAYGDVVGFVGMKALKDLVLVFPATPDVLLLGFPR